MGKIQILPPELVNQIAAGEVVERPSSVVKELVENAIDAGATRLEIWARDGGRNLRIADNGCGMSAEDLQVAFKNHATSKVKTIQDLFEIATLGFRGEALASISAIAKVTCLSRTPEAPTGLKATVSPAGEAALKETGCAVGTVFEIQELFYNVPARLKFLKRPQTELSHIQETVQMLALSHPEIAFQLKLEESQSLKTSGSGDLLKAIGEVFSLADNETLIPFELEDKEFGYRAWGHTSTPNVTRGSKKWMLTFVNGRSIRCPILGKAIESAYQSLITPGKFPVTILYLELPPGEVDVNVHPTKREVKYQRANTMFSFVRSALSQALAQQMQSNRMPQEQPAYSPQSSPREFGKSHYASRPPSVSPVATPYTPSSYKQASASSRQALSGAAKSELNQEAMKLYEPPEALGASAEHFLPQLPEFRVVGQLSRTYILVETSEGLLVVDQHIASERVLFEKFSEQAERAEPVSQPLLFPIMFPVSAVQSAILDENRQAFEALGFQYTLTLQDVSFNAVPSLYSEKVLKSTLENLLSQLEEAGETRLSVDDVIATTACHSAVRAGDALNPDQMERVMGQWLQCQRPWTCPHGRPVYHLISHKDLMSFFDRPSLPVGQEALV